MKLRYGCTCTWVLQRDDTFTMFDVSDICPHHGRWRAVTDSDGRFQGRCYIGPKILTPEMPEVKERSWRA